MKYDYTVNSIYGLEESCSTFAEAKKIAFEMVKEQPDCEPIIDQYYRDDELTGEWWIIKTGKLVKGGTQ